jgi:hypothetical protein
MRPASIDCDTAEENFPLLQEIPSFSDPNMPTFTEVWVESPYSPFQSPQPSEPPRPGSCGYEPPPPVQSHPQYPASNDPSPDSSEKFPSGMPQSLPLQLPHNVGSSNNILPLLRPSFEVTPRKIKRTEAYNNRHHKCERVDALNRGIWTSYGPGGTIDNPTRLKVEMYIRCSHGNCRRIDWKSAQGLQNHIVKKHGCPKGTIGSLENVLDKYGVPVSEVEAYERLHGLGSGGTTADSKEY